MTFAATATLTLARNTFNAILRYKTVYVAVFLAIMLMALMLLPFYMLQMAVEAGEQEMVRSLRRQMVVGMFGNWSVATVLLAIFLGASAISGEVGSRTIVAVLAKPVERWSFVVGKWLGTQAFLVAFLSAGVLLMTGVLWLLDPHVLPTFWIGIGRTYLTVMIVASVALALATVTSPVFAGGATFLGVTLVSMLDAFFQLPWTWARTIGRVLYYVAPARMPDSLLGLGLGQAFLDPPRYGLYGLVLLENLLYGLAALALACVLFRRYEIRFD